MTVQLGCRVQTVVVVLRLQCCDVPPPWRCRLATLFRGAPTVRLFLSQNIVPFQRRKRRNVHTWSSPHRCLVGRIRSNFHLVQPLIVHGVVLGLRPSFVFFRSFAGATPWWCGLELIFCRLFFYTTPVTITITTITTAAVPRHGRPLPTFHLCGGSRSNIDVPSQVRQLFHH